MGLDHLRTYDSSSSSSSSTLLPNSERPCLKRKHEAVRIWPMEDGGSDIYTDNNHPRAEQEGDSNLWNSLEGSPLGVSSSPFPPPSGHKTAACVKEHMRKHMKNVKFRRRASAQEYREILGLKQTLQSQRDTLESLYEELENERDVSASTAKEVMAMIYRLHNGNSAMQMEALHYERIEEERELHNKETIANLEEALMERDEDIRILQEEIEAHRQLLLRLKTKSICRKEDGEILLDNTAEAVSVTAKHNQPADIQSELAGEINNGNIEPHWKLCSRFETNYSSCKKEDGGKALLYNTAEAVSVNAKHTRSIDIESELVGKTGERDIEVCQQLLSRFETNSSCKKIENVLHDSTAEAVSVTTHTHPAHMESKLVRETKNNARSLVSLNHSNATKTSVAKMEGPDCAVMEHIRRLEEQLEHLEGGTHAFQSRMPRHNDGKCNLLDSGMPVLFPEENMMLSAAIFPAGLIGNKVSKGFHYSSSVKNAHALFEAEHGAKSHLKWEKPLESGLESEAKKWPKNDAHNRYTKDGKCSINMALESDLVNPSIELGNLETSDQCLGMKYYEPSRPMVKYESSQPLVAHSNEEKKTMSTEELVLELIKRMEALESDRFFMLQTVESLKKESIDLKLLQEIAQQLRELKASNDRNFKLIAKGSCRNYKFCFTSIFRVLLSFVGLKISSCDQNGSISNPCHKMSHVGLIHLLEYPSLSMEALCVARKLKFVFPSDWHMKVYLDYSISVR